MRQCRGVCAGAWRGDALRRELRCVQRFVQRDVQRGCGRLHLLDPPGALGDRGDAHTEDDEEVEGRRSDDRRGAQISRHELAGRDLDDVEQDLRG